MLHLRLSKVMLTKVLTYLELILRIHATFSLKRPHFLFISPPGHHLFYTHGQALGYRLLSVYRYGNSVDVGSIHQLDGHSIAAALTPDVSAPPITTHSVTTSSSPLARHYSLSLSLSICHSVACIRRTVVGPCSRTQNVPTLYCRIMARVICRARACACITPTAVLLATLFISE